MTYDHLTIDERNSILEKLTIEQRDFLENGLKRGRKTIFANALAKKKAEPYLMFGENEEITEELEWEFVDYIDGGAVSSELKCMCGRSLRYQYTVKNTKSKQELKFGRTHFEEHTGIPASIGKLVMEGFYNINLELDEILQKTEDKGYSLDAFKSLNLPNELIPNDILQQLSLELPLLGRQERRLRQINEDYSLTQIRNAQGKLKTISASDNNPQDTYPIKSKKEPVNSSFEKSPEDHFSERRRLFKYAQSTNLYQTHLSGDCMALIAAGLNSVNLMLEELLKKKEYKELFNGFTQRMCYIMVVSKLAEEQVKNPYLEGKGLPDRSDSFFYLHT